MKIVFWIACFFLCLHASAQSNKKPNILVIVSDDGGYADFECYGGTQIPTPHINALAQEGVRFTNAYVSASVCAPSRAGILTGRYQQRFGFEHNMSGKPAQGYTEADMGLDPNQKTIADELKANGYRTIAIGKWHQGNTSAYFPLNRGFDEFYGFKEGHRNFFSFKGDREEPFALYDNNTIVPEKDITYLTDMFTQKAVDFIDKNQGRPFFMYLAYNAIHTPLQAKQQDLNRFSSIKEKDRQTYAAMMTSMDAGIGTVLHALKEKGLEENTLVFFINDNGGATNNASDNGLLRGMKGSKWEGGIRVASIMKWPGHISASTVYNKPVISLDILPTALAAAHAKRTASYTLDGVDLLPYLGNSATPHKTLFWRRGVAAAVRSGKWKLIRVQSDPLLLFDLDADISETRNLADQHPEIVKDLLRQLEHWEKGLQAPRWGSSFGGYNQIMKHKMETKGRAMERQYP